MKDTILTIVVILILSGVITFVKENAFGPGSSRVRDYLISPLTWPGDFLRVMGYGPLDHLFSQIVVAVGIFCLQVNLFPQWVTWPARIAILFVLYVIFFSLNAFFDFGSWRRKRRAEARARRAHAKP